MSTSEETQTDNSNNNETKKQQNIDSEMNEVDLTNNNTDNNSHTVDKNIDNSTDNNNSSNNNVDIENNSNTPDKEMIDLENNDNSNINLDKLNDNTSTKATSNNISPISKNSLTSEPTEINGYVNPGIVNNTTNIDITQTNLDEPRDARVIKSILKTMGVQAHDPRVVNQLLEFMYKYVYEVLQDSIVYSEHSGKADIDVSDLRLSIQSRVNYQITTPPPRELLLAIADEKNKTPLPQIPNRIGVFLPADEYCLTSPNYQVNPPKHVPQPVQPLVGNTQRGNYNKKQSEKQIPIKFGNATIVSPPNLANSTTTTTTTAPPILPLSNVKPPAINKPTLSMPSTLSSPTIQTKTTAPPILGLGNKSSTTIAPPTLSMPPSLSSPTTTTAQTTTTPPTIPNFSNNTSTTKDTKMDDFDDFDSEIKDESINKTTELTNTTTATTTSPPTIPTNNPSPPINVPKPPDFNESTTGENNESL